MADSWSSVKASALKILGKDAKVPDPKPAVFKSSEEVKKAFAEFDKVRKELENKVLTLQNANSGGTNSVKQFYDQIEKEDFGLDEKNKDDAKKIDQAQKLILPFLQDQMDITAENVKNLDELDKHMMNIAKYKPAK